MKSLGNMYSKSLLLAVHHMSLMVSQFMMVLAVYLLPSNKVIMLTHLDPPGPTLTTPTLFLKNAQNGLKR